MTPFYLISKDLQCMIAGLFFIASAAEFALFLYKYINNFKFRRCRKEAVLFVFLLLFTSYLSSEPTKNTPVKNIKVPYILISALAVLIFIAALTSINREYMKSHTKISKSSIKEAFDNLNSGVCFADASGKIILINQIMGKLISERTGSFPQTIAEIERALRENAQEDSELETESFYRFSDGKVWKFRQEVINKPSLENYYQITSDDVTELYGASEQLKKENEELKLTNERTEELYKRLSERIREQETLNLKMRIHDEIGTSLIAISDILNGNDKGNTLGELSELKNAVSYFSGTGLPENGTFDEAKLKAAKLNIKLTLTGFMPEDTKFESIVAAAAIECVTNCAQHAKGSRVYVRITENTDIYTVTITNDGEIPKGKITEGGGLSSLRGRIESAGGEMIILSSPRFALIINLKK